jgi:acetyl esterase/lipase
VLVWIHAGGFLEGSKDFDARLLDLCLKSGISCAGIGYRFSSEAIAPAPLLDCARAIQFLRVKAKPWRLDPKRIAATGGSAGGGASLWLGFHHDLADPHSADPVLRQSSRLTCMVVRDAQCSYDPRFIRDLFPGTDTYKHAAVVKLFDVDMERVGHLPKEKYRLFEEASPIHHLGKDAPPVLLLYSSTMDAKITGQGVGIHHPRFGNVLKSKMEALGIECQLKTGIQWGSDDWRTLLLDFVQRHFAARPM